VCPVPIPVSGGNDDQAVRQHVLPEPAVKYELIERCLDHCWRSVQLIEKQNASAICRQKFRGRPLGSPICNVRETAQVYGIKQKGAYVPQ
jgi:hypothetical protein